MNFLHIVLEVWGGGGGGVLVGAFAAEVPTKLIQLYGNWRSDAYKKYLKFNLEDKISVANNENSYFENF